MSELKIKRIISFITFCFLIIAGIFLIISKFVSNAQILKDLAVYLAFFSLIVSAYFYVKHTKNIYVYLVYIIFVVVVITFLIIL